MTARSVSDETLDWLRWVSISPVPLRRLNKAGEPVGSASGSLIEYMGRRFLLSVEHALGRNTDDWVVQMETSDRGTEIFSLRDWHLGLLVRKGVQPKPLDMCYIELPPDFTAVDCNLTPRSAGVRRSRPIFQTTLEIFPKEGEVYAFAGHVLLERHADNLVGDMVVYPGLKFIGEKGDYHEYLLPVPHPGHDHFRGCSGAPIVNPQREIVGIVCGGDKQRNCIHAMPLSRYKTGVDFLCTSMAPVRPLGPSGALAPCDT